MTDIAYLHHITATFLHVLEKEGLRFGTDKHLQIQILLQHLPANADAKTLRLALVPLLARNSQEQTLLYRLFEECCVEVDSLRDTFTDSDLSKPLNPNPARNIKKWLALLIITFLILLASLWWALPRPQKLIERYFFVQAPIDSLQKFCLTQIPDWDNFRKITKTISKPPLSKYVTSIGEYYIDSLSNCFIYNAHRAGLDTIKAFSVFTNNGTLVKIRFIVQVQEDKPISSPNPGQYFIPILPRWVLLISFSFFLIVLWSYLKARDSKLVAEMQRHDSAPYFWNISIKQIRDIELGNDLPKTLQVLRRRTTDDNLFLDLPNTIHATASKGGLPEFRYQSGTVPVRYLLLIERNTQLNHLARLLDYLYQIFKVQEIDIERFFFEADPRLCYNEHHIDGISIYDLRVRYADARLMVVGTSLHFISPLTGRLLSWTAIITQWRERVLLSPTPSDSWTRDERRLNNLIPMLPITLQSLIFWVEELESGQVARFDQWRNHVHDAFFKPVQPDPEFPLPILLLNFEYSLMQWVAACAIYPSLHFDLTLWIGDWLETSMMEKDPSSVENKAPLVSLHNLLSLFRLSWFIDGEIPSTARIHLLNWLERENPDGLSKIRLALADVLEQALPPTKSSAWDDGQMTIALQRWLGKKDPTHKKQHETRVTQLLKAGIGIDMVSLQYLNRPDNYSNFTVPKAWKKYVSISQYIKINLIPKWVPLQLVRAIIFVKWLLRFVLKFLEKHIQGPINGSVFDFPYRWKVVQWINGPWKILAVWYLIIFNLIIFIFTNILLKDPDNYSFLNGQAASGIYKYAAYLPGSRNFHFFQLFTHMFMHGDFGQLVGGMFFLDVFGRRVNLLIGNWQFIFLYLASGLGGYASYVILTLLSNSITGDNFSIPMWGPGGAIVGIMMAFGYLFPDHIFLKIPYLPISIKAKYGVIFYVVIISFYMISSFPSLVDTASIGGGILGLLFVINWERSQY